MPLVFSAVVVNYNGVGYLERCLKALLEQDPRPDDVVVVDNASTDESIPLIQASFPDVRIVEAGGNFGPSVARNRGMAAATHDRCLVLDNDVVLGSGVARRLLDRFERESRPGMVQARSVCGDRPDVVHYDQADLHFLGLLVLRNWFRPLADARPPDPECGAGIGLCFVTDRAAYDAVGGFDENMFFYFEDTQFSWKLRLKGFTLHLEPDAVVTHLAGTAGLSMRGEKDPYPSRRTRLHSRNRWYVLFTCMRWRTLLLTLPAQLMYGLVFAVFAHARGHGAAWWASKWELVSLLPRMFAARRAVQRGRQVSDRDLLICEDLTLNPGLADRGLAALVRRTMNRTFAIYWRVVRRLCG